MHGRSTPEEFVLLLQVGIDGDPCSGIDLYTLLLRGHGICQLVDRGGIGDLACQELFALRPRGVPEPHHRCELEPGAELVPDDGPIRLAPARMPRHYRSSSLRGGMRARIFETV